MLYSAAKLTLSVVEVKVTILTVLVCTLNEARSPKESEKGYHELGRKVKNVLFVLCKVNSAVVTYKVRMLNGSAKYLENLIFRTAKKAYHELGRIAIYVYLCYTMFTKQQKLTKLECSTVVLRTLKVQLERLQKSLYQQYDKV